MKTKIALIPAYKPDIKLITLIESLIKTDIIPVVVNDGSGNEFDGIFQKANEYCKKFWKKFFFCPQPSRKILKT